ncbi:hypothetical protein ACN1C3_23875 [Pseudomonas sp. H11T01]|uniref:hypothetical protein n=1 Tax=Pseudomonas sp. H11T01 TaxID=3402749 RepID=UPI003AD30D13
MRQNRRQLLALVMGVALLILAITLNRALTFTPFHLIGLSREWWVGPREIAHMIGLTGFTVAAWYFISSFASRRLIATNIAITVAVVVGLASSWPEDGWLYDVFGVTTFELAVSLSPIYLGAWALFGLIAWKTPSLLRPKPALMSSCLVLVMTTALWELYIQPFDNVYGGPPRGWIEMAQVLCDLVGILFGALIVQRIAGWPEPQNEAVFRKPRDCI